MTTETNKCPCCGQGINATTVNVSFEENWLRYGDQVLRLTSRLADLAYVLAEKMPETVRTETIIERMWGAMEGDFARANVGVGIMQLRKTLKPIGLRIVNTWGIGYRLEVVAPASRTERNYQPTEALRAQA